MRAMFFDDLHDEGICKTRTTLAKWIREQGFPPGRLVGKNRVWTDVEVFAWITARPSDKAPPKGAVSDMSPGAISARVAKAKATKRAAKVAKAAARLASSAA